MSKSIQPKRYDLKQVIKDELGKRAPIIIKADDVEITVPPAILWPDEVFIVDDVAGAKILLGDNYDAFVAAGGTAPLLFSILAEANGADLPE
jgi:hypothetical protein